MTDSVNSYALPFALLDLRLYLDTHPDDSRALAVYRQLCGQIPENHDVCLPGNGSCTDHWCWVDDPWPWEPEANICLSCASFCSNKADYTRNNQTARRV